MKDRNQAADNLTNGGTALVSLLGLLLITRSVVIEDALRL